MGEETGHLRIAHLMEIAIVEADRPEPDRRLQADGFVGSLGQGRERIGRRYGHGEDQPRGGAVPHGLQRDPHRRTGGDAVIDNDRRTPGDFQSRTAFAIRFSAPLDFFELTGGLLLDVAVRNIQTCCQIAGR